MEAEDRLELRRISTTRRRRPIFWLPGEEVEPPDEDFISGGARGEEGWIRSVERKRNEEAHLNLAQEAFINGVSKRKIERPLESSRIKSLLASQVSEITRG